MLVELDPERQLTVSAAEKCLLGLLEKERGKASGVQISGEVIDNCFSHTYIMLAR